MPDFAVSTAFKAQDQFSQAFRRMEAGADKFGRSASGAFDKAGKSGTRLRTIMGGILAANVVQQGVGAMQQGMGSIIGQFIEFDDAIMGAGARFKDIGPNARNFNQQLDAIKAAARDAGATTEFTAAQAAGALDFLARAGFSSTEAIGSLRSMINLSTATGEEFVTVADMSSDLLGAFGLAVNGTVGPLGAFNTEAEKTAQKIKNLNRLNDVLVMTTNSANVTVEDMFETMKQVGPVAKGVLGASLEEVSALTAVLGNSGIKGSEAMTALKNAYLRLAAPVGAGADMLKRFSITLDDGKGGAKKMTDLMAELGGKIQGLGKVEQAAILDAIFGKYAIAGGKNILDNISNIKEFEKALLKASGTSEKTADIMRQSWGNQLKSLGSGLTEKGFQFLDAFSENGKGAIAELIVAVRAFDMTPAINGVKSFISTIQFLHAMLKPFYGAIMIVVGGFLAYNLALKAQMALQAAQSFFAFISVLRTMTGAQSLLNLAMMANPIGMIIAGITAAIAVGYLVIKNWELIGQTFGSLVGYIAKGWDWIKKAFITASDFILDSPFFTGLGLLFAPFFTIPALIIKHWEPIKKFFGGLFDKIRGVSGSVDSLEERASQQDQSWRAAVTPPNRQDEIARRNSFKGRIDIAGAPPGSTAESESFGEFEIDLSMMGAN